MGRTDISVTVLTRKFRSEESLMLKGEAGAVVTSERDTIQSFVAATWEKVKAGRNKRRAQSECRQVARVRSDDAAARRASPPKEHDTGDDDHVSVPAVAVNKAARENDQKALVTAWREAKKRYPALIELAKQG